MQSDISDDKIAIAIAIHGSIKIRFLVNKRSDLVPIRKLDSPEERKRKALRRLQRKILEIMLLPEIRGTTLKVMAYIWREQTKTKSGWTEPVSVADICKEVGKVRSGVTDAIKQLSDLGCLQKAKGKGRVKRYRLIPPAIPKDKINYERKRKLILKKQK